MNYWLIKSEPSNYSIDDLKRDKRTAWTGVRNYQARNHMKSMSVGDLVIFWHSSTEIIGAVGVAKVCSKPYPDEYQFDRKSDYYDAKSTKANPRWWLVDFCFVSKFTQPITLADIKSNKKLAGIMVAKPGVRLSVQPVSQQHFEILTSH
jgi:predicted RNA-binding protein with PUA-like domain